jgi:hypothetical protein
MYACAGSADITNWSRAIIVIDPTDTPGLYRFIAAKRSKQIGWKDESWQPVSERYFAHAKGEDSIYWVEVDASVLPKPPKKVAKTPEAILPLVPVDELINKDVLIHESNQKLGIGVNKVRDFIKVLVATGKLCEVPIPRKGKGVRPEIFVHLAKARDCPIE